MNELKDLHKRLSDDIESICIILAPYAPALRKGILLQIENDFIDMKTIESMPNFMQALRGNLKNTLKELRE